MLEFIQKLKKRYQIVAQQQHGRDLQFDVTLNRIEQLMLAEAFIEKGQLIDSDPKHALQLAIIGPTQVGKSTVVNLLLNSKAAGVSALAGYTVHPQGFYADVEPVQCVWLKQYFDGFQQVEQEKLDPNNYALYSLTAMANTHPSLAKNCLVWDTPDFDSIDAAGYREGVLRTIALADIIIMVVSKEKYADQAVWDMLALIEPLNKPTLIVVNKLVPESQDMVLQSLTKKWQQALKQSTPELIPLAYHASGKLQSWPDDVLNQITRAMKQAVKNSNRRKNSQYQKHYLNTHWQAWLEPVMAEYNAKTDWQTMLDQVIEETLKHYQRDYLNHPHHYETFNDAVLELLTLLEIPGIAKVLAKTRRVLTWPARKILGIGKRSGQGKGDRTQHSQEIVLLNQKAEHLLIQLAAKVLNNIEQGSGNRLWWQEINKILRTERTRVSDNFDKAVEQYHVEFQGQVEATAQQLYLKLQEQPIVLNSLRATRLTTDSAAVLLAIHTGGIGLQDLIITPVILSVTSLLAESALGSYMKRSEAELKQKQLAVVKQQLFELHIKVPLLELPDQVSSSVQFNIPKQQLEAVEKQLKEKKHGLRLF